VLVELRGEFDRHNLENLQGTLNDVAALRQSTLVDLSGVTFLDVGTSRELAIRSLLYAHRLILRNPSWQVRASMVACGFGAWATFAPIDRAYPRLLSKEPLKDVVVQRRPR
jgi:anti-anti-sigma regulatory factor